MSPVAGPLAAQTGASLEPALKAQASSTPRHPVPQVPERGDPIQGKQTGGWSQRWHSKGLGAEQRAPWQPLCGFIQPCIRLLWPLPFRTAPPPPQEQRREGEARAQDEASQGQ